MLTTKQELLEYLSEETKKFQPEELERYSAGVISGSKSISRSLASQYLNELVKEGRLIKVNSRPVCFFHRKVLESIYRVKLPKYTFSSMEEMLSFLKNKRTDCRDFKKAVGAESSLSNCVEQCKAAISYPPTGLPILLEGDSGVGKSFFAQLIYEYAINNEIIDKDKKFYIQDCSEFAGNPSLAQEILFGKIENSVSTPGVLEQAEGSLLFLDEAQFLPEKCQNKLAAYLENGGFCRSNSPKEIVGSTARLILATSQKPEGAFQRTLLRRLPVTIHLPSLVERSEEEKEGLIAAFFESESMRIGKKIVVSRRVLEALLNYSYNENVREMESIIQTSCAAAYLNQVETEKPLTISLYHLPDPVLFGIKADIELTNQEEQFIEIERYIEENSADHIVDMMEALLRVAADYASRDLSITEFLEKGMHKVRSYYDYIAYGKHYTQNKIRTIQVILDEIFTAYQSRCPLVLPSSCSFVLARNFLALAKSSSKILQWESQNRQVLDQVWTLLKKDMPKECSIATEIFECIRKNLDIRFYSISRIFLTINIAYYNRSMKFNDTMGIIIGHGYAVASSMADTVNQMLGSFVFYGMDMPLDISSEEIATQLIQYITAHKMHRNVVILVDMGSLERLGEALEKIPNFNIGIMNRVSMAMALSVGAAIQENAGMEELMKRAAQSATPAYQVINTKSKCPAILFTSESGIESAERMMMLFDKSLMINGKIQTVVCDFYTLLQQQKKAEWFEEYQVLCIVGTMNPQVPDVQFFSLDSLIDGTQSAALEGILSQYLKQEEATTLSETLLKNFSLNNVVQNLTILNADTLLEYVVNAVKELQILLNIHLSNRMLTVLYVHISCMVERLVTKMEIQELPDEKEFLQEHGDIVAAVHTSFQILEKHYRIRIPTKEIAFLYDCITADTKQ